MPTLTISGTISFPLGSEATPPSRPFSAQVIYSQKSDQQIVVTGAQENVNLMGLMTDAKACYIEVVEGEGTLSINPGEGGMPLDLSEDGGFWIYLNPNGGLVGLTVTTTDDAEFLVYLFA